MPVGTKKVGRKEPLYSRPVAVMTVREVSAYLHVHPSTIYRLVKQRQIPAFQVGSDWRFNVETIDRWCRQKENASN
jgi:excisionase family DNA binding protein